MIHLDRSRVSVPDFFHSDSIASERSRLAAFYSASERERGQRTFKKDRRFYKEGNAALAALSYGKCGYCETPVSESDVIDIDSFRPNSDAINLDGTVSRDHYWWLTYEWENLVPACRNCNHLKGRRFPVLNSRAPIGILGEALKSEGPLLLNPFDDNPADDLIFSEDGMVAGKTERGRISIEVFGLNREALIATRREAINVCRGSVLTLLQQGSATDSALEALVAESQPYAAPKRQFLQSWVINFTGETSQAAAPGSSIPSVDHSSPEAMQQQEKQHFARFRAEQVRQESFSVASEQAKSDYFIRTRYIERIEIENFRPIEKMTLRFANPGQSWAKSTPAVEIDDPSAKQTPWLMLLGENGVGKSSVLQAVALCLLGDEWRERVGLDATKYLRIGAETGSVRVFLTGASTPITLSFSGASSAFLSDSPEPKLLLLGYGSTRLLPKAGVAVEGKHDFAQTDNLFNPFVPLVDANAWLLGLDEPTFDSIARALKNLLQLSDNDRLIREPDEHGRVEAEVNGTRVPLEELSDGYQSVLAVTCDIMRVLLSRWPSMEIAEGLVLLDEIGAHLHPRWRMRMINSMRKVFPRVQFLASTHDPLCLRGLEDGEVTVIRRDFSGKVVALDALPSIKGLRVDQLLTSEFFGLSSTVDPDLEALFEEYYHLLATPTPTAEEKARIDVLRVELDKFRVLGSNRRERIMLEVIDEFLAKEPDISDGELRQKLTEETKKRVREIWDGPRLAEPIIVPQNALRPAEIRRPIASDES